MCTVICVCRYTLSFCINLTSNWPCELCPRISCISPPFVSYRHPSSSGSPAAHRSSLPLTDTQTELHYSVARVFHKNKQLCSVCELLIRVTFDLLLLMCVCSHSLLLSTCGSRSSITSRFFCRSEWASWSFTLQKTHTHTTLKQHLMSDAASQRSETLTDAPPASSLTATTVGKEKQIRQTATEDILCSSQHI